MSKHAAFPARLALPALLALPFVVGFDLPDSSGSYARISAGRGAYHITGCQRNFDSEYWEGQMAMKHRFRTGAEENDGFLAKLRPSSTTIGYFVDVTQENLTLVAKKSDTLPEALGSESEKRALGIGLYFSGDWKWVGLQAGALGLYRRAEAEELKLGEFKPMLGLRVGPLDRFYGSYEHFGSSPLLSGGATEALGLGTKFSSTRLWLGLGKFSADSATTQGILKASHAYGPWTYALSAAYGLEDVPPAGLGLDREYGFSLGLEYRISH